MAVGAPPDTTRGGIMTVGFTESRLKDGRADDANGVSILAAVFTGDLIVVCIGISSGFQLSKPSDSSSYRQVSPRRSVYTYAAFVGSNGSASSRMTESAYDVLTGSVSVLPRMPCGSSCLLRNIQRAAFAASTFV